MRGIGTLGLVVAALGTLGATATPAFAELELHSAESPVKVVANQKSGTVGKFTIGNNAPVECEKTTYTSAEPEFITTPATTGLFKPLASGCKAFGFLSAELTALKGPLFLVTRIGGKSKGRLACTTGFTGCALTLVIKSTGCVVSVGEQELEYVGETKNLSNGTIEVPFNNIRKIAYSSNEKGTGCPKNGEEARIEGVLIAEGTNERGEPDAIEIK